jgi:PX-associated
MARQSAACIPLFILVNLKFLRLFAEKNISGSLDRSETTKRQKLAKKFERLVLLLLSSGIHTTGKEESVTNPEWADAEEDSRGALSEASDRQLNNLAPSVGVSEGGFDVNVAGVRTVWVKRHVREHKHAEFIICTKRPGKDDVYVGRRHGAFKRLSRAVLVIS